MNQLNVRLTPQRNGVQVQGQHTTATPPSRFGEVFVGRSDRYDYFVSTTGDFRVFKRRLDPMGTAYLEEITNLNEIKVMLNYVFKAIAGTIPAGGYDLRPIAL